MSKPINDGGPAFPRPALIDPEGCAHFDGVVGMSLRDYYIGQAIVGKAPHDARERYDLATRACRFADDVIAARDGSLPKPPPREVVLPPPPTRSDTEPAIGAGTSAFGWIVVVVGMGVVGYGVAMAIRAMLGGTP